MNPLPFPQNFSGSNLLRYGYMHCVMGKTQVVALDWAMEAVKDALGSGTLHDWASMQPLREEMRGRSVVYSAELPGVHATSVVVRRNRHGGLFQGVTGEYFLTPTRAPLELATALRLAAAGIPTPEVIAYVIYPAFGFFARSDVMTRRLPVGSDAPAAWRDTCTVGREAMLPAMAGLLRALAHARAWHADLNLKNIYISGSGADATAYLLDVDRVTFPEGTDIAARNFKRLARSIRKWRTRWGLDFNEDSLGRLALLAEVNE